MQFHKVIIENFLSFEKEEVLLQKGLHLISGWNNDAGTANGSGKSTIVDSICWALTGDLPRKVSSDAVINWKNKKGCKVELTFSDGSNKYKILRGRAPNVLDFYVGTEKKTGKSIVETQEIVEKTIGINYSLFLNSVYFAQNSQTQFVTANDNTKKDLLTELLNLNVFDTIHEKIKLELKDYDERVRQIGTEIIYTGNAKKEKEKSIEDLNTAKKSEEEQNKQKVTSLLKENDQSLENFVKSKKMIEDQNEDLKKAILIYRQDLDGKRSNLSLMEGQVESEQNSLTTKTKEKENLLIAIRNVESEFQAKKYEVKNSITKLETDVSYKKQEARKYLEEAQKIEKTGIGQCPNCYQQISKEALDIHKNELLGKTSVIVNSVNDIQAQISAKQAELNVLDNTQREEARKYEGTLLTYSQEIDKASRELQLVKNQISSLRTEISSAESQIQQRESTLSVSEERIRSLQNAHETLKERNLNLIQEIEKTTGSRYDEMISKAREDISSLSKKLVDLSDEEKKIAEESEYKNFLKDAFGNKGIKSYVFEQVVNEINVRSNENLKSLFDSNISVEFKVKDTKNTKGEYSHKFETEILVEGEAKEYGSLSGGEKRRIILAVDLAVSQIIQNRSSRSISLLVFDEYFEGLDEIGKEKVMDLLKQIEDVTVLVIDHSTRFQNLFDYEIKVEKTDRISRIV